MKYFSLSDVVFTVVIVATAIFMLVFLSFGATGQEIEIKLNGHVEKVLPLNTDTTYEIKATYTNIVEIKDSKARIIYSDCPNKVCTVGSINSPDSAIVCAPNHISITVLGKGEIDAITQ